MKFWNKNKLESLSFPEAYIIYERITGVSNEYIAVAYNRDDNDCLVRQKDYEVIVKTSIKAIRAVMNRHDKKILVMSIDEKSHLKNYRIVEKWM